MLIKSFKGGYDSNFCYVVQDSGEAVIIDPFEPVDRCMDYCREMNLKIKGVLNTHSHHDHVEGNPALEKQGIPLLPKKALIVGKVEFIVIPVPGHTKDSVAYLANGNLFTGDTLFVGKIGRTWSEQDAKQEQESLKKLMMLPDETVVWPGHDYGNEAASTIGKEKQKNPYLRRLYLLE